jgi:hypothetical protein
LQPFLRGSPLLKTFALLRREKCLLRDSQAEGVLSNHFRLTNVVFAFESDVDWSREDLRSNALAGFELHYQAYLEDLALAWHCTCDPSYARKWRELVRSWIENNPPRGEGFARFSWSPYVIAERTRNWIASCYWLGDQMPDELWRLFELSLAQQVAFLSHNLERDLQANHLLQNLCGLVVGLCFFGGRSADAMKRAALLRLARAITHQVLPDGMHEERSFSYQLKALSDLLEVLDLAQQGAFNGLGREARRAVGRLSERTCQLAAVVAGTLEALPELPLLNDCEEVSQHLSKWAVEKVSLRMPLVFPTGLERLRGSGYLVGRDGPWAGVFDIGPAGPRHQMGHGHADHLGFELWHGGKKLVCDSGNATYAIGKERQYYRGTAAHNTVRIDGEDSLELWGSFRVGRRPKHCLGKVLDVDNGGIHWYGEHDGYRHLNGSPRHRRWFHVSAGLVFVCDVIEGQGEHQVESFLHFHPDATVAESEFNPFCQPGLELEGRVLGNQWRPDKCNFSSWTWRIGGPDKAAKGHVVALWLAGDNMSVHTQPSLYAPAMSVEKQAVCLRLAGWCRLPLQLGWLLFAGKADDVLACRLRC